MSTKKGLIESLLKLKQKKKFVFSILHHINVCARDENEVVRWRLTAAPNGSGLTTVRLSFKYLLPC